MLGVAEGVAVGDAVAVGEAVAVEDGVGDGVVLGEDMGDGVAASVGDGVAVAVAVGVGSRVAVAGRDGVIVGVTEAAGSDMWPVGLGSAGGLDAGPTDTDTAVFCPHQAASTTISPSASRARVVMIFERWALIVARKLTAFRGICQVRAGPRGLLPRPDSHRRHGARHPPR
jgi:hypothetical protein